VPGVNAIGQNSVTCRLPEAAVIHRLCCHHCQTSDS